MTMVDSRMLLGYIIQDNNKYRMFTVFNSVTSSIEIHRFRSKFEIVRTRTQVRDSVSQNYGNVITINLPNTIILFFGLMILSYM